MKSDSLISHILIDEYSATPKYKQLVNAILYAIETGKIEKGNLLPSINELSFVLEISRDTAEKGYRRLRKLGVIESIPGKGYFVINTDFSRKLKICLLFNKLSTHKKIIYDSFTKAIGEQAAIDLYVYNNDFSLFRSLLNNKKDDYTHYVIIPHFNEGDEKAQDLINAIPREKLVILDKLLPGISGDYAAVYENFALDIYNALEQALVPLSKYDTLKIIFPKSSYFPKEILDGFYKFCQQYAFNHQVVDKIIDEEINNGEVYISLMEDDLVTLIEKIISLELEVGKDVGVISYNEIPLKRIILDGITTISTDFAMLGTQAANCILNNITEKIHVPFYLNLRKSL
ncbi:MULTISPECIES: GntR family transcriptional regulator [Pedobacter]|uniref:GntR family transcriptional regulator n=1 Tax=Pedobacter TaxID=84567 RepID=UPI002931AD7D|nr:GntR family transcriptional regulator [Pedobacter aquatilis]